MVDKKIFLCAVFYAILHLNTEETMEQEEEIYKGCLRGDNRSRKELYNLYAGKLLAIGLRYLGNRESAEDVLHDVFIHVFGSFDKFSYRGKGSLLAWLSRIMVNTSLEHLRKAKISDEMVSIDTLPDDIVDADKVDLIPEEVLMRFIQELPDGYRTVFNLYAFEDKSHKEIAQLLGINERSSSSQYFRARSLLAKRINEYLKDNER